MPARVAQSPGAVPFQLLVLKLGLREPQHKVCFAALVAVSLHTVSDTHSQVFGVLVAEDIVSVQPGGVKVDIASGQVRISLFY